MTIEEWAKDFRSYVNELQMPRDDYKGIMEYIDDAIVLLKEQEANTGKWIPVTNGRGGMECSICHDYAPSYQDCTEYLSEFCPNCGAKMESR